MALSYYNNSQTHHRVASEALGLPALIAAGYSSARVKSKCCRRQAACKTGELVPIRNEEHALSFMWRSW